MPVRIGFVGTGGIAGAHFNQLEHIKDAQLVAFADMNVERAQAAAERFGGNAYSNASQMLNAESLDAVDVCLPTSRAFRASRRCAKWTKFMKTRPHWKMER